MVEINYLIFFLSGSFLVLIGFLCYKEIYNHYKEYKKEEERDGRRWFKKMVKRYAYRPENLNQLVLSYLKIYPKDKEWVQREAKRCRRRIRNFRRRMRKCGIRTVF